MQPHQFVLVLHPTGVLLGLVHFPMVCEGLAGSTQICSSQIAGTSLCGPGLRYQVQELELDLANIDALLSTHYCPILPSSNSVPPPPPCSTSPTCLPGLDGVWWSTGLLSASTPATCTQENIFTTAVRQSLLIDQLFHQQINPRQLAWNPPISHWLQMGGNFCPRFYWVSPPWLALHIEQTI